MGQFLHGNARTTEATRLAIQRSQESVRGLARRCGVSPTTVRKWKMRDFVTDARMGPKHIRSTNLAVEQEAACIALRRHTLLSSIPTLTRSSLHRLFQRYGISRLADVRDKPSRLQFKTYAVGYVHIDIAEVRTEEGELHLFVGIDRTSKLPSSDWRPRRPA